MSSLLAATELSKTFGTRPLFENLSFVVEEGDRVGLIGPNGAGKSTLISILAGKVPPDDGTVAVRRGLVVGLLEQTPKLPPGMTVEESVTDAALEAADDEGVGRVGALLSKLDLVGIADSAVESLSGGWQKRVALARELVRGPDLLFLDEPTNHLDIESILWLETFLAQAKFAVVVVTHDRLFLQRTTNRIVELDRRHPQGTLSVRGDYATYVEMREARMAAQEQSEASLKNRLRRETEWLRRGAKARTTKQQARIKAHGRLAAEVEDISERNQSRSARLSFESGEHRPKRLLEAKAVTKRIGNRTLFRDVDLFLGPGSRVGLLGRNGCGKSTLLRILLGEEQPDAGTMLRSDHLKVAHFAQHRQALDPKKTVRATVCPHGDQISFHGRLIHVNGYLDRFLFRKEQSEMPVGRLSGGEQSRLLIALLMLQEANLLVLDEPTNDLDTATLDVLADCLEEFEGAVLLVTHDRYFLDQVCSEIHAFPPPVGPAAKEHKLTVFADWSQWERWHDEQEELARRTPEPSVESKGAGQAKKKKLGFKEERELQTMEKDIEKAETLVTTLQSKMLEPDVARDGKKLVELSRELEAAQSSVEKLYARWNELEAMRNG